MTAPERWRQRAARVRGLALAPLAAHLGYRPDPSHRQRWRRPGSVLALSATRFFDHAQGRGGGGAIDLVMHAEGASFAAAVEFLETRLGTLPPAAAPAPRPRPAGPHLPPPVAACWPTVRAFLHTARGLDLRLLAHCRHQGLLYADSRRNAVFVCRDAHGTVTGAELVGTQPAPGSRPFKALAPGSRKASGGFWLPPRRGPPTALLLVESALDALAALQTPPPGLPPTTLLASTAGVTPSWPPWLHAWPHLLPLCGFDADPAGDRAAAALQLHCPALQRFRPRGAKDWNDLLRPAQPS